VLLSDLTQLLQRLTIRAALVLLCLTEIAAAADCMRAGSIEKGVAFKAICAGGYTLQGGVTDGAEATIHSRAGDVILQGGIGAGSRVNLRAPNGRVRVAGDIGAGAQVCLFSKDGISVTGKLADSAQVFWQARPGSVVELSGTGVAPMEGGVCLWAADLAR
jgi:hypothetical protein